MERKCFGLKDTVNFYLESKELQHIITARKRSLGQGNIFTSVCQEFCSQGSGGFLVPGGAWSGGSVGGSAPGGVPGGDPPPGRLLLQVVRILLECILVSFNCF